jgi:SAM-dependent methyltransferase
LGAQGTSPLWDNVLLTRDKSIYKNSGRKHSISPESNIKLSNYQTILKSMKKRYFLAFICLVWIHAQLYGQSEHHDTERQEMIRNRWDKALVNNPGYKFNKEANNLLRETIAGMPPGKALDVAMGQGRNTLFLASQGWAVTGFYLADEAVAYAQKVAQENNLSISTYIDDFESFDYGDNQWELITWIYGGCLEVDHIAERIRTALKPGGIFLFEFFHRDAGLAMNRPDFGCETNAIRDTFQEAGGFQILRYE